MREITITNVTTNALSERSAKFDLTKEDALPDLEFNEVLWEGLKALPSLLPAGRRLFN